MLFNFFLIFNGGYTMIYQTNILHAFMIDTNIFGQFVTACQNYSTESYACEDN